MTVKVKFYKPTTGKFYCEESFDCPEQFVDSAIVGRIKRFYKYEMPFVYQTSTGMSYLHLNTDLIEHS